jgi:hypothetical protein
MTSTRRQGIRLRSLDVAGCGESTRRGKWSLRELPVKIEYFHASKYGNGATVAQEFKTIMSVEDDVVSVHHIRDANPHEMPPADCMYSAPREGWASRSVVCAGS